MDAIADKTFSTEAGSRNVTGEYSEDLLLY